MDSKFHKVSLRTGLKKHFLEDQRKIKEHNLFHKFIGSEQLELFLESMLNCYEGI